MGGGDGYLSPIIGGLGALIRDWIRSRNYSPGVAGWQINADGSAEFNDITARGNITARSLKTGEPPDAYILIEDDGSNASIELATSHPDEMTAATIFAISRELRIDGADFGFGEISARWNSVDPTVFSDGGWDFIGSPNGPSGKSRFALTDCDMKLNDGGLNVVTMPLRQDPDAGPRSTTSTAYASASTTANVTGLIPPSGRLQVACFAEAENTGAGSSSFVGWEIRDTNVGGAVLVAAADARSGRNVGTLATTVGRVTSVSGLTAGGTFFARPMFRVGGNTGTFNNISIHVSPGL